MNDIIPFKGAGGGLISREDLAKSLENASMSMPAVGGDYQYLKMEKGDGAWVYGQDETEVEEDSLWAVNPLSLMHGWVAWDTNGGGAPVQEFMVPINRPLPPESSLPPLGLGTPDRKTGVAPQLTYQQQRSVDLVCISGEDEGIVVQYKQSSVGAMKLFGKLTNDLYAQLRKDPDNIVAVVKLTSDSYKHKTYGKIFNPILELVEWRSMSDTSAPGETDEPEPEQEQPATRQRTRSAAPPQEPEPDAPDAPEEDEEAAALAAEYAAEQAAAAQQTSAPRRRVRR